MLFKITVTQMPQMSQISQISQMSQMSQVSHFTIDENREKKCRYSSYNRKVIGDFKYWNLSYFCNNTRTKNTR